MDFSLSPEIEDFRIRIRDFVATHVIPLEGDSENFDEHEMLLEGPVRVLREKARAQGLWCLQMPKARGGQELGLVGMAACYEEMSRSPFGPLAFNSMAPDDGTMMVLEKVLPNEDMKQKWLQPLVDGEARSAFAMTEPHPGGGSDPSMMLTTAEKKGDKWVIRGRKHFITGAEGAKHLIVIAKTSDDPRKGLTAFIHHADDPGWHIERRIPIMGPQEHGGHCEVIYDGLEIPDDQRLLEVGDGLKVTQIRLGPARLTHCMRWLGQAKRALEIAAEYTAKRESFGIKLDEHEGVQWMMGEAAMDIQIGRMLTMHAAWMIDQGDFAKKEISMAKVQVADTLHKAIDTAIQLCGAHGYSKDTLLEWMYRYARQARLVDGASEIHKMVLSRQHKAEGIDFWSWGV
ncbi:MAG: acyl-CoA dehydrogenase [Rhodospirillaceae bacterium]|jgi:acyl-CoA dehydrogenase|nr:acyl-CoA dehydrogenase [Rhodospirillaceae bacterium]MBT5244726.1 acyl-CoA dehydrogenase [Rhodospirillaceae bacterium]MBT5562467.1 acyl-CoA dehydrogenase [Rhodospirillaceae bacterium]MBT6242105.1 acyl-CoA dehydrogenase [Rhodospirillaceae bacterium]MBT7136504.1 acyl-CoA dehydrogenase [Rhodospirillaceae bacterium]